MLTKQLQPSAPIVEEQQTNRPFKISFGWVKYIRFLAIGIFFGIVMTKSQVISWYRMYEMFRFDSFHIYGIIVSAVSLGVLGIALIKRFKIMDHYA